ncbi:2OG-Fe(II) oxygenase [Novosphingobium umbonatum]|uniref:2OG-Fe(II) oxygenase n=1 Tax=Novosphingobium umbonatum TaxID=1908524 RepID=A0A3S2UP52_9SPHN|nr:2OG-Fe(II) oxygenase [Novosphingobium umbonatum]RVU03271.1 2OG-Fe(II) oxygenase [Novosphingobium umbonatum]
MINFDNFDSALKKYGHDGPFDHCVIDGFFEQDFAKLLESEMPDYDHDDWYVYRNSIENKKTQNSWEKFPSATYRAFAELQSAAVTDRLARLIGAPIYVDHGLHGGGWHIHGVGGNLNPHFDYSIHPKLKLERVLNIIVYISSALDPKHGGALGLWSHDEEKNLPKDLVREVDPVFNRAVLFNTTQNSWHGMSSPLTVEEGIYRKSLAIYYLRDPAPSADARGRALFAPRVEQREDSEVLETIRLRANVSTSGQAYRR